MDHADVRVLRAVHQLGVAGGQQLRQLHPDVARGDPRLLPQRAHARQVRQEELHHDRVHHLWDIVDSDAFRTRIDTVAADDVEPAGQAVHQHGVQQHLHLHGRAVPHAGAAPPARRLLHGRQDRSPRRATDTAADGVHGVAPLLNIWHHGGHLWPADDADAGDFEGQPTRHSRAGREHGQEENHCAVA